jgi:hypothetical protein
VISGVTPVIVADSADMWIAACLRLLDDPASAASMAARARSFVIDHFSWAARLRTLDALLPSACSVKSEAGSRQARRNTDRAASPRFWERPHA